MLFAKDRLKVILAAAWFVALELAVVLVTTRDWKVYGAGFLIAAGTIVVLSLTVRTWKSSYEEPRKTSMAGLLFVVAGFVAAAAIVLLLKPKQ